ncbi:Hpt domain-containing protein [Oceanimonas baumannii]|uniref:Hpt domain-containing protein n=1 Tax=Oceanimonas baumannii TaxID=129578 RepID=UPI003A952063
MSEITPLDKQLTLLRERFTERTLKELQEIRAELDTRPLNSAPLPRLQTGAQLLHRLAGSSGTFGFNALGKEAARLEHWLNTELAKKDMPFHQAERLVADLSQHLSQLPGLLLPSALPDLMPSGDAASGNTRDERPVERDKLTTLTHRHFSAKKQKD